MAVVLAPAAHAVVIPASTTKLTYDFANSNTTPQTSGPSSIAFSYSKAYDANGNQLGTGVAKNIGVTASAWNLTQSGSYYTVSQGVLGQYVGGLGVTAPSPYDNLNISGCANAQCGTHQLDSGGSTAGSISTDVIQLVFSEAVTLGSVTRNAYGLVTGVNSSGNYIYAFDDDMSWGKGSGTGLTATTAANQTSFTQTSFNNMWNAAGGGYANGLCAAGAGNAAGGYYGCVDTGATNTQASASNSTYASKVWYISAGDALGTASGKDTIADAFKVTNLSIYYYTAQTTIVPEPATWATMVLGFGVIGSSIRRRRAAERLAGATAA